MIYFDKNNHTLYNAKTGKQMSVNCARYGYYVVHRSGEGEEMVTTAYGIAPRSFDGGDRYLVVVYPEREICHKSFYITKDESSRFILERSSFVPKMIKPWEIDDEVFWK